MSRRLYRHKRDCRLHTAKRRIKIFKFLTEPPSWSKHMIPGWYSPYRWRKYHFDKPMPEVKVVPVLYQNWRGMWSASVDAGYHAYTKRMRRHDTETQFVGYVPKGARYMLGSGNEIVASTIIVTTQKV